MSDVEKKPEPSAAANQRTEKIDDLPPKTITAQDAETVKGGSGEATLSAALHSKYIEQ